MDKTDLTNLMMCFCLYYIIFYYFISVLALSAAVSPHFIPVAIYLGTFIIGYLGSLAYEEQSLSFFLLGWTPQPTESDQTILLYFLLVSLTYKSIFLRENSFLKEVNQLSSCYGIQFQVFNERNYRIYANTAALLI